MTRSASITLGIGLLTFAVFAPHAGNNFVTLDDTLLITHNAAVQSITTENIRTIFTTYDPELYVPLTLLTYQIEYALAGPNPLVFHLVNVLLHATAATLLFLSMFLLLRLYRGKEFTNADQLIAAGIALTFALHPLQTEAVAWAAARKDVLSGMLAILSLYGYLRWIDRGAHGTPWLSGVAFGLGLLAKVSILPLVVILPLIDLVLKRSLHPRRIVEKLPHLTTAVVLGCVALFGKTHQLYALSLIERAMLSLKALGLTLLHLVLPLRLRVFYPELSQIATETSVLLLSSVALLLLIAWAFLALRREKMLTVLGVAWFIVFLAPSLVTFWKNGMLFVTSDRYAYLALIGIVLAVLDTARPQIDRFRKPTIILLVLIVGAWIVGTTVQARTWRDSETLYRRALIFDPAFAMSLNNLGSVLMEEQRTPEAEKVLEQALVADPLNVSVLMNLALIARERGDIEQALATYQRAVAAIPADGPPLEKDIPAYFFLGQLLEEMGRTNEALDTFRAATARAPDSPDAHLNLGIMLQKYGRRTEAVTVLTRYLELKPRDLEARYRLAAIEAELGHIEAAIEHLEIIVGRVPDYEKAAEHLAALRALR